MLFIYSLGRLASSVCNSVCVVMLAAVLVTCARTYHRACDDLGHGNVVIVVVSLSELSL